MKNNKTSAPTTLPKGAHIHLTQETEGRPADTFAVGCQRVKGDFFRALGIDAHFVDADWLEEQDMFDVDPGWRIEGTAETLRTKFDPSLTSS